jgi:hypothetical protein
MKSKLLQIRISEEEKREMAERAKKEGFSNLSQFLLWLYRKFGKG